MSKQFDKYQTIGPDYHYRQIDRRSLKSYSAPVDARFRKLVENVKSEAGERKLKLLDVGCGDGVALYLISKSLPKLELYGIDPVAEALSEARKKMPGAKLFTAIADTLPFEKDFFDIIISVFSRIGSR